jgi:hypothetical protein
MKMNKVWRICTYNVNRIMEHCRSYDVAAGTSREMRNGNVKKKEI